MADAPKLRVLFVDDEPAVLRMLRMGLRAMSQEWEVVYLERGDTALAVMEEKPFDVVVTDMRMGSVSGAGLINELLKRFPQTVRLVVSGYADEELVMKCVAATHQYFAKPPDLERLKATIRRIACLGARLNQAEVRTAVARMSRLPSAPAAQGRLIEALESPSCSTGQIGDVVASDPSLTAQVLKLVNSAFFGFTREVSEVAEAVQLLGVGTLRSLALTFQLFARFDTATCSACALESIWTHSRRTAALARRIAQAESADRRIVEQAFTAGLLHDIGKLILAADSPTQYAQVLSPAGGEGGGMAGAELSTWQTTSADVGAYLLGLWGLPAPLVDTAAYHHAPSDSADQTFTPLTAVHVASLLARESGVPKPEAVAAVVDTEYLQRLRLVDRLPDWVATAAAI